MKISSRYTYHTLAPLLLFICVVSLYAPSIRNGFIYDDHQLIITQPASHTFGDVMRLFTEKHLPGLPYYRPLPRLTLLIQKAMHGNQPGPFHLFNAILMGIAALLTYALLRLPAFGIPASLALLAGALWTFHPIASSCVHAITARETIMATIFTLASVYSFLRGGRKWYAITIAAFTMALFTREHAVTIPLIFIIADLLGLSADSPGRNIRRWIQRYLPVACVLLMYTGIRHMFFSGAEFTFAFLKNPANPPLSFIYAIQVIITPFTELIYEPTTENWLSVPRLIICGVFILLLTAGTLRYRQSPELSTWFWLGWFVVNLLPTANLLKQEVPFAERYVFPALLGIVGIIASIISAKRDNSRARRLMVDACLVLIICCAGISFHRAIYFKDDLTFSRQWLKTNPDSAIAHNLMGGILAQQGDLTSAIAHYAKALRTKSNYVDAHNNLGTALFRQGKTDEAIGHYYTALRLQPGFAEAHNNIGLALAGQGKFAEAIRHYAKALRIKPHSTTIRRNMAMAYSEWKNQ